MPVACSDSAVDGTGSPSPSGCTSPAASLRVQPEPEVQSWPQWTRRCGFKLLSFRVMVSTFSYSDDPRTRAPSQLLSLRATVFPAKCV